MVSSRPVKQASALYRGVIRHRRLRPRPHDFRYPLFMVYLDLDELDTVFAGRWLWSTRRPALARFRRRDYFGDPALPLAESVRRLVEEATGRRPEGPIRLLTHLRYFGHQMNPVSFYYCFAESENGRDETLEAIVAEITNTPWNERHCYVLAAPLADGAPTASVRAYRLAKDFHVSPFMPMDIDYRWRFSVPAERLAVHMESFESEAKLFDATLALRRKPITGPTLAWALARHPFMTVRVVAWIYLQAALVRLKGNPFHPHPQRLDRPPAPAKPPPVEASDSHRARSAAPEPQPASTTRATAPSRSAG